MASGSIVEKLGTDSTKSKRGGARQNTGGSRAGAGRPKGIPNKIHSDVKQLTLDALNELGGVKYLKEIAISHPQSFCSLLSKCMPVQVNANAHLTANVSVATIDVSKLSTATLQELVDLQDAAARSADESRLIAS